MRLHPWYEAAGADITWTPRRRHTTVVSSPGRDLDDVVVWFHVSLHAGSCAVHALAGHAARRPWGQCEDCRRCPERLPAGAL